MKNWSRKLLVAGTAAGLLAFGTFKTLGQAGSQGGLKSPAAQLVALGFKFNGAGSCSNSDCHGAAKEKENGYAFSNEFTLWSSEGDNADPHHSKTWAALRPANATAKKITTALKIPDATKSERCLTCHSLSVPANLHGKAYKLNEGVTCEACHGPSEKWLDPHSKKGWYKTTTAAASPEQMLTKFGLYETLPVQWRAERCTSCHLAIEPDLVAAGHPQPTFELNYFSETYPSRHWHDPEGYFKAKLWAGGQQVALRDALLQLASRANTPGQTLTDAFNQAMSHYTMVSQIIAAGVPDSGGLAAAMQKVQAGKAGGAALASAATAAAAADEKLGPAVEKFEPTKATDLKMLQAVAAQNLAATYGKIGMDQESYAIYALYSAYASAEKPKDADAVTGVIGEKLFPDQPQAPTAYAQSLAAVRAKLPK